MSNTNRKRTSILRFSLRTLALLMTLAAMITGLVSMNRSNRQLADRNESLMKENQRLRDELGELSVADETQLHAIRTASGEELEWAWRIWIPEGHEYKLRGNGGMIPKEGWLQEGGTSYLRKSGEHVIRYRILKDPRDGKWYGSLSTRSGSAGKDLHEWVEWGSMSSTTGGVSTVTQSFSNERDNVVELCRHRVSQVNSSSKIEDPSPGFLVWLERIK